MVHVNYHPDKWERMKAIWAYFVDGKKKALDAFPDGSCEERSGLQIAIAPRKCIHFVSRTVNF